MSSSALRRVRFAVGTALLFVAAPLLRAQQPSPAQGTRQLQTADLKTWNTIRQSAVSSDGKWFAYVLAPNEGTGSVVLRSTGTDGKETKYPIGEPPSGRGGIGGGSALSFSGDSRWLAFTIYAAASNGRAGRGGRGAGRGARGMGDSTPVATPAQNRTALINLSTGEKKEFDAVRRFEFNGDAPSWIAMQSFPPSGQSAAERTSGSDLVLYKLATA
jgi:hypothetical protein